MKTCNFCQHGAITDSMEVFADDKKIKAENLNIRYCLLTRDFTNFTIPQDKDKMFFDCDKFTKKT